MNSNAPGIFKAQSIHLIGLLILLPSCWKIWESLGSPFPVAFWICILIPTVHQIYVWLTWRLELRNASVSNTIGFKAYLIIFFLFLLARPVSLFYLAHLDQNSLGLNSEQVTIGTIILALPALYAFASVKLYFGFTRAAGADHFKDEYRSMPLVKKGIFKYTNNGMYVFGFLGLWAIAIGYNSTAALLVAGFSHISIWIHYYATEKSDLEYLYGSDDKA